MTTQNARPFFWLAVLMLAIPIPAILAEEAKQPKSGAKAEKPMAPQAGKVDPGNPRPVEAKLNQLRIESDGQVPPHLLAAGRKGTEELISRGIAKKALQKGGTMPRFRLTDAMGKRVQSGALLSKGPLVLVFYRGAWCPYCNLYLQSIQEFLPQIEKLGASLVAVSGEPPDKSLSVAQRNALSFTVLSDPKFELARKFGIVYEMPKVVNDAILEFGFDLKKYYSTDRAELPLSATYVIDTKGKIVYAFLDPDYKKRAEPADVIAALKTIKK